MDEDICPICGYPEWWVDNDCQSCSMTFEQALEDISRSKK